MPIKNIIWDWNGTLLNDVNFCLETINTLLKKHNIAPLTIEKYKEIFTFPVIEYYKLAGFDLNKIDFNQLSVEFISTYEVGKFDCSIFNDVIPALEYFSKSGFNQYILSASKVDTLLEAVDHFGLRKYFTEIRGLDNIHAHGKLGLAQELRAEIDATNDEILLVGDTLHDFEVAQELGIKCALTSHGHQSMPRLKTTNAIIIDSLLDLTKIIES